MTNFEKTADLCGFIYDPEQDIYITKKNCLQRLFGYGHIYDCLSLPTTMIIDVEPIIFDYNSDSYLIELWKGQYNVMTGCEVGVYHRSSHQHLMWESVNDREMLEISYQLVKINRNPKDLVEEVPILSRHCTGWWVTGFKPGLNTDPLDLVIKNVSITFPNKEMCQSFATALMKLGYVCSVTDNHICFDFVTPKNPQPWSSTSRKIGLSMTRGMVSIYNWIKATVNGIDNSPRTIDRMLSWRRNPNTLVFKLF